MTSEEIHELAILHGAVFTYAPALEEWWDFPPDNLEAFVRAVQESEAKKCQRIVHCLLTIKKISHDHAAVALAKHALEEYEND